MVSVQGEVLRAAAKTMRDDVLVELVAAREVLPDHTTKEDYGPTVRPSAHRFLHSWRAELLAVVEAASQLATSLDGAAANYDGADQDNADQINSIQ